MAIDVATKDSAATDITIVQSVLCVSAWTFEQSIASCQCLELHEFSSFWACSLAFIPWARLVERPVASIPRYWCMVPLGSYRKFLHSGHGFVRVSESSRCRITPLVLHALRPWHSSPRRLR